MNAIIRRTMLVILLTLISTEPSWTLVLDEFGDAKKAYQKGQYDEALRLVIIKLRKDNDHQAAIALFKTVMKLVIDRHQAAAEEYEATRDWESAVREYDILRRIGSDITSFTALEEVKVNGKKTKQPLEVPKVDVRERRTAAIGNAAEAHYQRGTTLAATPGNGERASAAFQAAMRNIPDYKDARTLAAEALYRDAVTMMNTPGGSERVAALVDAVARFVNNYKDGQQLAATALYRDGVALYTRKDYKRAVQLLRLVNNYVAGYKDAAALAEKAKQAAIQRVAVMPFTNLSGKPQFGDVGQIMTERIISSAMGHQSEFLQFVTREYVTQILQEQRFGQTPLIDESTASRIGKLAGIHAFVFGKVLSITASYPPLLTEHGTHSVSICCNNGQPFVVSATWTKHTMQGYVEIGGSFQIIDVEKGSIVRSESINKRMEDRAQWVTYSGDERAIPGAVRAHHTTGQRPLDPAEQLAQKAIEQIANSLASNLAQFFR